MNLIIFQTISHSSSSLPLVLIFCCAVCLTLSSLTFLVLLRLISRDPCCLILKVQCVIASAVSVIMLDIMIANGKCQEQFWWSSVVLQFCLILVICLNISLLLVIQAQVGAFRRPCLIQRIGFGKSITNFVF